MSDETTVHHRSRYAVATNILIVAMVAAAFVAAAVVVRPAVARVIALIIAAGLSFSFFWRAATIRLTVDREGITVRNLVTERRWPWSEVRELAWPDPFKGLEGFHYAVGTPMYLTTRQGRRRRIEATRHIDREAKADVTVLVRRYAPTDGVRVVGVPRAPSSMDDAGPSDPREPRW